MPIAMIASLGVVGAAAYALRLFIRVDAQPRRPEGRLVRDRLGDALAIVPMVLVILVFAFYPQFGLSARRTRSGTSIAARARR